MQSQDIIVDFQQHVLYAFLISVLQGMAVTSEEELERLHEASARGDRERLMDTDDDASVISDVPNGKNANNAGAEAPGTRNEPMARLGFGTNLRIVRLMICISINSFSVVPAPPW